MGAQERISREQIAREIDQLRVLVSQARSDALALSKDLIAVKREIESVRRAAQNEVHILRTALNDLVDRVAKIGVIAVVKQIGRWVGIGK